MSSDVPQRIHAARLRRIEQEQARAAQVLGVLRAQIRLLRAEVGLAPDPVLEDDADPDLEEWWRAEP